jgi:hypothetical protein
MKKYDTESFLRDIETFLKANLNNAITALNTEKGDFNLKLVDDLAYIYQTLDDKVVNFSPALFYYIDDIVSEGIHSATSEEITVELVIILADEKDNLTQYKLLRYLRVLKDLFNLNFNKVHYSKKVKVESLVPIVFALQNTTNYVHAIGVKLTTVII